MDQPIDFDTKEVAKFREGLKVAQSAIADLSFPLGEIAKDWFKSNRTIFMLKGPGGFPDLAKSTQKAKQKFPGFIYPILERTGRLSASITQPSNPESINLIINRRDLVLGTAVPYGIFHQMGTKKMPKRQFVFIGPESTFASDPEIVGRLPRWLGILHSYCTAKLRQSLDRMGK